MVLSSWKFEFRIKDEVEIEMPNGAQVLYAGSQKMDHVCLWALVNPSADKVVRKFNVVGTGHPIKDERLIAKYVSQNRLTMNIWPVFEGLVEDTFLGLRRHVWHVFEVLTAD
jgi:hypothetical protein